MPVVEFEFYEDGCTSPTKYRVDGNVVLFFSIFDCAWVPSHKFKLEELTPSRLQGDYEAERWLDTYNKVKPRHPVDLY